MIILDTGYCFEFTTASGAMGYDGRGWPHEQPLRWLGLLDTSLFTHEMKSITLPPRKGNFRIWKPWDCIRPLWRHGDIIGFVNAYGLSNPGFDWWMNNVGTKVDSEKVPLIGSFFGEPNELEFMARNSNNVDFVAITYNGSCPNSGDDVLSNTKKNIKSCEVMATNSRHPLIYKASIAHNVEEIIPEIEGMIAAIEINSVPWNRIFPNQKSPLAKYGGGGVSGKIAQQLTWALAEKIANLTDVPVIVPSIWDYEDIETMRNKGFKAFSFGSVFMRHPCRPTQFVKDDLQRVLPIC